MKPTALRDPDCYACWNCPPACLAGVYLLSQVNPTVRPKASLASMNESHALTIDPSSSARRHNKATPHGLPIGQPFHP
ncbi:Hypothetical protein NTJ_13040 [Nesidiocoris tenuis]|uniref:4Fe-4S ferredoxin-type domain-containing protein n=1 Tax=Nesidiocoris tenuis TaxID=355587 RepID=A0ABN7B7J8_9HEMI|nr:Hypothetical protein NTJ_13040 [Nesidiocoris tenuis]